MIDDAARVKELIDCKQFADSVGLKVNRSGFAVCPFHKDNDASLKIYNGNRGWYCFGCNQGGDVISFASLYYGIGFKETLQRLNYDFDLGLELESTNQERDAIAAIQMAKRKAARQKAEADKARLEAEYWRALDRYMSAAKIVKELAPKNADDDACDMFVDAVTHLDEYRDALEEAEARLSYHGKE